MPILYARFIWGLCLSGGQVVPCGIEGKDRRERVVSPIMLDKLVHNRWPRVGAALFGSLLLALAINLFIVPQHLYTSGLLGLCQVIRTLLDTKLGIRFSNFDLAGTLYLLANLPLLLLAYKTMGRTFVVKLALCTVSNSLFLSIIPIPAEPIIPDMLTSCLVGGILAGFSNGLVLTCGASCGGLDILGLYLSKKGRGFTVGRFSPAVQRRPVYPVPDPVQRPHGHLFRHLHGVQRPVCGPGAPAEHHHPGAHRHQAPGPGALLGAGAEDGPGHHLLDRPRRLHRR